jgi:hypothetical protein
MKTFPNLNKISKSQFAESVLRLKGHVYSLDRYPMFRPIYDLGDNVKEILLKTGRQVSKSTFNAKDILIDSMRIPHLHTLFVTPLQEQTNRFSKNYLAHDIKHTPFIQKYYWDTSCQDNVFSRGLTNGSLVHLTYSLLDAERARGIAADKLVFDEVQDIPWENIPIINECLSASRFKWRNYTGTPKTLDNTIEKFWQKSTQCEWAVKCSRCGKTNIPDEENVWEMIGLNYPVCAYCDLDIRPDIPEGRWVMRNHNWKDPVKCPIIGFHIPQIVMPIHYDLDKEGKPSNWIELRKKQDRYSESQFANECLGLSYDQGGRLITITELMACSKGRVYFEREPDIPIDPIYMGIDWGISAQTSFTAICVGGFDPLDGKFKVVYMKRFASSDTLHQIEDILEICERFGIRRIGADCGVGHTNNLILKKNFGDHKVYPFNYATANNVVTYNKTRGYYSLDKTTSLNLMFMAIKQRQVQFPLERWMGIDGKNFYADFLSIYEEIVESTRGLYKVFTHNKTDPDDMAHAMNFCMFAAYVDKDHEVTRMATNHDFLMDD